MIPVGVCSPALLLGAFALVAFAGLLVRRLHVLRLRIDMLERRIAVEREGLQQLVAGLTSREDAAERLPEARRSAEVPPQNRRPSKD